jgi:hypothetical protein
MRALKRNGFRASVINIPKGDLRVKLKGPDEDAIQAAVLTVRFFIQKNEKCSIYNLAKIYGDTKIPRDLREDFSAARKTLNDFLDGPTVPAIIPLSGKPYSVRMVLESAIYGDLSHVDEKNLKLYEELFNNPFVAMFSYVQFVGALIVLFRIAFYISKLNKKVLKKKYLG